MQSFPIIYANTCLLSVGHAHWRHCLEWHEGEAREVCTVEKPMNTTSARCSSPHQWGQVMLLSCILAMMWRKEHVTSVDFLSEAITLLSSWGNHQTNTKWEASSKALTSPIQTVKAIESKANVRTVTAQRSLRRCDDEIQCGFLGRILEQQESEKICNKVWTVFNNNESILANRSWQM